MLAILRQQIVRQRLPWRPQVIALCALMVSSGSTGLGQTTQNGAVPGLAHAAAQEELHDPWSGTEKRQLILPLSFRTAEQDAVRGHQPSPAKQLPALPGGAKTRVLKPSIQTSQSVQSPDGVQPANFQSPFRPRKQLSLDPVSRDDDPQGALGRMMTVISALSVVLGLFFGLVWVSRRVNRASLNLPIEVIQPLGRFPLSPRQQAHVVRFGSKLLVLAVSGAGTTKLAELTDPEEVDHLTEICLSDQVTPRQIRYEVNRAVRDRESSAVDEEPQGSRRHDAR